MSRRAGLFAANYQTSVSQARCYIGKRWPTVREQRELDTSLLKRSRRAADAYRIDGYCRNAKPADFRPAEDFAHRYLEGGIAALERDAPRPGKLRTLASARVQEAIRTTQEKLRTVTHGDARSADSSGFASYFVRFGGPNLLTPSQPLLTNFDSVRQLSAEDNISRLHL